MEDLKKLIPSNIYEVLERAGLLSIKEILTLSEWDLKKDTNMNVNDISLLKNIIATHICPSIVTFDKIEPEKYIGSGCTTLDEILCGGFRKATLTEIYGESGSGKTQLAMQVAAQCGSDGCVYFCTEDVFPIKRFIHFSETIHGKHSTKFRNNMHIEHITDPQDLISCIRVRLPKLLEKHNVSAIIVDSIAAPFRCDESNNYIKRAEELREVAATLLHLAETYDVAILCINQVTSSFDEFDDVLPSLGLAWSNMISSRFFIKKTNQTITFKDAEFKIREFVIVFCPYLDNNVTKFIITHDGIKFL